MSKVYVIHDTGHFDLTEAAKYGKLTPIFTNSVSLLDSESIMNIIYDKLIDMTDDDYILCIGSPILIMLVGIVASEMDIDCVNFLTWDKKYSTYVELNMKI